MIRLLILSPRPPWLLGGVEKVVKETATRLAKGRDITVEIWCKGEENQITEWEGIPIKIFRTLPFGLSLSLIKELRKAQDIFDIIHIHGTSNFYPLEALLAVNDWKKVVVSSHYHPKGSNVLFRLTKPIYDIVIVSRYLRKARRIVCVSKTEKNIVLNKFKLPRDKVKVMYNGVPIDKIRGLKSKRVPKQNEVSILYFGRLEKYKNIHIIIEALKYLPDTFVLYIVGKGPYEKELHKLTKKLGLENRVRFLGFLPEEELYSLLHSVDIVVNLSEIEAFGIMVIESIAAGKPVIVNNKLGLRELAEYFTSVYSTPTLDAQGVANLLKKIVQRRKFKAKNLSKFNWDNILREYLRLYVNTWNLKGDDNHDVIKVFKIH